MLTKTELDTEIPSRVILAYIYDPLILKTLGFSIKIAMKHFLTLGELDTANA